MGNHVFGCDDCLAVCPWNKFAQLANEQRFHARPQCDNPPLRELLALDEAAFRTRFAGTPIKRAGRDCFLRNVLIASGNSGDATLVDAIMSLAQRTPRQWSAPWPIWALGRVDDRQDEFSSLRLAHEAQETDMNVKQEWREA